MASATIPPEDVASNLAKWAKFIGLDKAPDFLTAQSADTWMLIIGGILVIIGLITIFIKPKKQNADLNLRPNPVPALAARQNAVDSLVNDACKPAPFADFIEMCKAIDPSYSDLPRKPEVFIPFIFFCIEKMRKERNTYDYSTLHEVSFRYSWTGHMNKFFAELLYVLNCLNRLEYIDLEMIPGRESVWVLNGIVGSPSGDKRIKFRQKYLDLVSGAIFHDDGKSVRLEWR